MYAVNAFFAGQDFKQAGEPRAALSDGVALNGFGRTVAADDEREVGIDVASGFVDAIDRYGCQRSVGDIASLGSRHRQEFINLRSFGNAFAGDFAPVYVDYRDGAVAAVHELTDEVGGPGVFKCVWEGHFECSLFVFY